MNFLELQFSIRGQALPADHGYALYSAVKRLLQEDDNLSRFPVDLSPDLLLSSVPGIPNREGIIYINKSSRFRLRCPSEQAQQWYRLLQNQVLDIRGHLIRLIQPRLTLPEHSKILKARLVTFRLQNWDTQQAPFYFLESCQKALEVHEIKGKVLIDSNPNGDLALRALKIREKNVLGYGVVIEDLIEEDSIKLQGLGLGGRRHFGCGWFYPAKDNVHAN